MELKAVKLHKNTPTEVTVSMSVIELAQITKWLGELNGDTTPEGLERFYFESTGRFFNRFWTNGVEDCLKGKNC